MRVLYIEPAIFSIKNNISVSARVSRAVQLIRASFFIEFHQYFDLMIFHSICLAFNFIKMFVETLRLNLI